MEFGRQLELPDRVAFGSELMAEILAAEGSIRPFNQIRYMYISVYIQSEVMVHVHVIFF